MKEEMKETIQEDLNNFKTWGIKYLTWLKKWWVRAMLVGGVTWNINLFVFFSDSFFLISALFILTYIALYVLIVWLYGKDKNK